jgi:hypothetical protein
MMPVFLTAGSERSQAMWRWTRAFEGSSPRFTKVSSELEKAREKSGAVHLPRRSLASSCSTAAISAAE